MRSPIGAPALRLNGIALPYRHQAVLSWLGKACCNQTLVMFIPAAFLLSSNFAKYDKKHEAHLDLEQRLELGYEI